MQTALISKEPYLFQLLPESAVESLAIGQIVRVEVERYRDQIDLPFDEDLSARWECASTADGTGRVRASVVITRRLSPEEVAADPLASLFGVASDGTAEREVERLEADLFVTVNDPAQPDRLEVMYEIPQCAWTPSPQGSSNYLHYGPKLYRAR